MLVVSSRPQGTDARSLERRSTTSRSEAKKCHLTNATHLPSGETAGMDSPAVPVRSRTVPSRAISATLPLLMNRTRAGNFDNESGGTAVAVGFSEGAAVGVGTTAVAVP